jgi:hypothetical protein
MYYRLTKFQEEEFLRLPETGMGYQIVEATKAGTYSREKFIVINSEIVIEMNGMEEFMTTMVLLKGRKECQRSSDFIQLNSVQLIDNKQFRDRVNEHEKGALDNPVDNANGEEIFIRLSAFDIDRRVDKENNCLIPGSFTITSVDYFTCKYSKYDPVERYALPCNNTIKYAYYIRPVKTDMVQRGTVQPANGQRGGGKESFFANGTAKGTFYKQTRY